MAAPACRDCGGSGQELDVPHYGESGDCSRCRGVGVEVCGECTVRDPDRLVVAEYHDRTVDGARPYNSQVCEVCARRLCGLIDCEYETESELEGTTCRNCGWVDWGTVDWGYLDDPMPRSECAHSMGNCRQCTCCSTWWHRPGMVADFDEGRILKEDCPDCIEWLASPEGMAEMARQEAVGR